MTLAAKHLLHFWGFDQWLFLKSFNAKHVWTSFPLSFLFRRIVSSIASLAIFCQNPRRDAFKSTKWMFDGIADYGVLFVPTRSS